MITAESYGYLVIQWPYDWDPSLADLLLEIPEVVLEMRVAITSCDSGPYRPSAEELAAGWRLNDSVALSPVVNAVSGLPTPGFDEWYVFDDIPTVYPKSNYVNRYGFTPLDMDNDETKMFWFQVVEVQPLHVLAAGTPNMFFATRDKATFERVKRFNTSLEPHAMRGSA